MTAHKPIAPKAERAVRHMLELDGVKLYTAEYAAVQLGVSVTTIWRRVRIREMAQPIQHNGRAYFNLAEVKKA